MGPGGAGQSDDGVAVDADEAPGLADAVALGQVLQDRDGGLLGEVAAIQRRALALGEAGAAGAAVEEPKLPGPAESAGNGEVSGVAAAEVGTSRILATESREVVHGLRCGLERVAGTRVEALL